jgi:hypothetical protein
MKNIVWLVSYPKSGNTWFRMFLANYLSDLDIPVPLEGIKSASIACSPIDFEECIGLNPYELTPNEVDLYRPNMYRVLSSEVTGKDELIYKKVHDAYTFNANQKPVFPEDVSKGVLYFVRNPLDVCISYANHSNNSIDNAISFVNDPNACFWGKRSGQLRQILLTWNNHVKSWLNQSLIPIHWVRYEDMLMTPIETFGRIVQVLGLEYNPTKLSKAILFSDFKNLRKMEKEHGFSEKPQKCSCFFRKGEIGNYREYLSQKQIESIIECNRESMQTLGYLDSYGKLIV